VILARYGHPAIARRHLEQVASAVLLASSPEVEGRAARAAARFQELARRISEAAQHSYRTLVAAPDFAAWFAAASPLEELGSLRIGSRPARRGGGASLEDLRAIPWVFAWSQTRLNLPGWYGLGSGLAAAGLGELREAYAEWPLFRSLLDNAEMSLAKTDRRIAARYLALGSRPELSEQVLAEYDLTIDRVLAVTGHQRLLEDRRVLSWAVELRNPYVDALSHLQLRALRALREGVGEDERQRLERLLLLTVNGVAAGLQNTG
jgi:phosphoenolpyruvate carboxylase